MGIPIIKIRRSDDRLIFIMGIPTLVRSCLFIESTPGCFSYIMCLCPLRNVSANWRLLQTFARHVWYMPAYPCLHIVLRLPHFSKMQNWLSLGVDFMQQCNFCRRWNEIWWMIMFLLSVDDKFAFTKGGHSFWFYLFLIIYFRRICVHNIILLQSIYGMFSVVFDR